MTEIILNTRRLPYQKLSKTLNLWAYNGLDCLYTHDLHQRLTEELETLPEIDNRFCEKETVDFKHKMLEAVFNLMRVGMKVDQPKVAEIIKESHALRLKIGGVDKVKNKSVVVNEEAWLQRIALASWGKTLNYRSDLQIKNFLYKHLGVPEQKVREGRSWKVSVNYETLQKVAEKFPHVAVVCHMINKLRTLDMEITTLGKNLDADGRFRCSYNLGGTDTERFSSRASVFDTGGNAQNIKKPWRVMIIPDRDEQLIWDADYSQAESRIVAYTSGDEGYIKACESGDLHSYVASMVFNEKLEDIIKWDGDKEKRYYFKQFTHRDMAKRAGHGLNYLLQPKSLAKHMKIDLEIAQEVHDAYFEQFSGIKRWHNEVAQQLEVHGYVTNCFGYIRWFWDRTDNERTLRQAIATIPQSTIPRMINLSWMRMNDQGWPKEDFRVGLQVHDSLVGVIKRKELDFYIPQMLELMSQPVMIKGRRMVVPSDCKVGPNWRDLKEWTQINP